MRLAILIIMHMVVSTMASQKIEKYDFTIDMQWYQAYYSNAIKAPAFVVYKLWKGGGHFSRKGMNFRPYMKLPHFNYLKSGYDKGHLCNAEDMAKSYEALKSTFYYINAIPQWPTLNRGLWAVNEKNVRRMSQGDSLLIICGGLDYNNLIPKFCFKVVYSLSSGKLLQSLIFCNDYTLEVKTNLKLAEQMPYEMFAGPQGISAGSPRDY